MLAQRQKEFATARHFYLEALAIFERWGDQRARVSVLAQLGSILQNEGKCEEARGLYDEALKIFEELNDQDGRATTLGQLGLLALQQADYATALRFAAQAATIHGHLHSPQRDTALQTLLRIQTEIGDTAFSILWQQAFHDQPLPDLSSVDRQPYPLKVLMAFIQAQTPAAARRIIETHPTLLSAEAERLLEEMATMAAQRDDKVDKMIEPKHALLSRCRRIGVAAAFAELHQGQGE
jgi:tetratricopeptide (TPR) repeat protein